tara:strand:- start:249 stop:575 length:327 start_codon:yes stop_codon:yes gene_type:complete
MVVVEQKMVEMVDLVVEVEEIVLRLVIYQLQFQVKEMLEVEVMIIVHLLVVAVAVLDLLVEMEVLMEQQIQEALVCMVEQVDQDYNIQSQEKQKPMLLVEQVDNIKVE